jgi:hypothetical protein
MDEYFLGAIVSTGGGGTDQASAEGRPACGLYETCTAPLCPLDQDSLKGIWYPDEEICRSRTHGSLPWIRAQRKIARAEASGYFNLVILKSIRTIRKGITGLDPNAEEKPQLRRWLGLHEKKRQKPVSAPLENMSKPGGQGKKLCRNGGSQHPDRTGTDKPPSRRSAPRKIMTRK